MKYKLEIELGNDTMRDAYDLARVLREAAGRIESYELHEGVFISGRIHDVNGNKVGKWSVE